jgi:hypothetical protein
MYDFEWYERELSKLKRDFAEGSILQREFDEHLSELQCRKAKEREFFRRHPPEMYGDEVCDGVSLCDRNWASRTRSVD